MVSGEGIHHRFFAAILLLFTLVPVSLSTAATTAGDVAPYGNPDGQLNAGDMTVIQQFILGTKTPTNQETYRCDVAPLGAPDGYLNAGDMVVLQRAILGLIPPPLLGPGPPLLWGSGSTAENNPYFVSGLTQADTIINVYLDGVLHTTVTANGDGLFNANVTLTAGAVHTIWAKAEQGGVESLASDSLTVSLATQAAPADLNLITIAYNTTDTTVTGQAGSVAANATVTVNLVDGTSYTTTADASGGFNTTINDTDQVASIVVDDGSASPSEPAVVTAVGTIAGKVDVSNSGAATYSVPIAVPPGTAGMQPNLALAYSSQSDNGLLGTGWSLGGLSSITRCPATMAQDGLIDPVDFDTNDKYCMDGQRLIEVTNTTCASVGGVREYRTEIESFSRVCDYGQQGSGPAYFIVWSKSGQVIEYGVTGDARIEAEGEVQGVGDVIIWSVNKISDKANNYLKVGYIEDNPNVSAK